MKNIFTYIAQALQWLKSFAKRHKLITTMVVIYLLYKIYVLVLFTAWMNPFASDTVTIKGRFPFDKGFGLVYSQNAVNTYDWHRRWCGGLVAGRATCTSPMQVLAPTRVDANHYTLTVKRDAYFKGVAGWEAEWGMDFFKHNTKAAIFSGSSGFGPVDGKVRNYACSYDPSKEVNKNGRLFCMDQLQHKNYKHLILRDEQINGNSQQVINFWLYSELDQLITLGK